MLLHSFQDYQAPEVWHGEDDANKLYEKHHLAGKSTEKWQ